jgi:hypothetical protein
MFQPRIPGDEHPGLPGDAPVDRRHDTLAGMVTDHHIPDVRVEH